MKKAKATPPGGNGGGSDSGNNFCFRCTQHLPEGQKPCSTSHGSAGPNKGPHWRENCQRLEGMEHRDKVFDD